MNHQIPETQTIIEAVRTKLKHTENKCSSSVEFHVGKTWTQNPDVIFSVGTTNRTGIENRSSCVSLLCIVCGKNNPFPNQTWATKLSEVWDPTIFMDKYDIAGRPVQFHWHTFSGHAAVQIKRGIRTFLGSTEPWDFRSQFMFMSMFNDIEDQKPSNEQKLFRKRKICYRICKANPVRSLVFLWTWTRKSVVPYKLGQTSQRMGSHRQENEAEV